MNVARGNEPTVKGRAVITFGKFESLHLGHRALIGETIRAAETLNAVSAAITFRPHPQKILREPDYKPVFTERERLRLFESTGLDYLIVYDFDRTLADMSPAEYCGGVFNNIDCAAVVVGGDFRFGRGRSGDGELLSLEASKRGIGVVNVPNLSVGGERVCTSRVRESIIRGDMKKAKELLGFGYFLIGKVVRGRRLGRSLGFPTVNMEDGSEQKLLPPFGVYATKTTVLSNGDTLHGVTNVGVRPTFDINGTEISVETHFPGYAGDLYGEELLTEFVSFIRPEMKFERADDLKKQIEADINESRRVT